MVTIIFETSSPLTNIVDDAQDGVMATRQAQQALVPGRLVLVSDPVTGMSALSVVLGEPQGYTAPSRTASATGAVICCCLRHCAPPRSADT